MTTGGFAVWLFKGVLDFLEALRPGMFGQDSPPSCLGNFLSQLRPASIKSGFVAGLKKVGKDQDLTVWNERGSDVCIVLGKVATSMAGHLEVAEFKVAFDLSFGVSGVVESEHNLAFGEEL